jgi:hypothetical protein
MKNTLKLEELAMTAVGIYFLSLHNLGLPWWAWLFLFFAPDIGMLGYLVNTKIGAIAYNVFHHKGLALGVAFTGFILENHLLLTSGILLFTHASFDRIFGFGLKYPDSFHQTHLGRLNA